MSTTIAELCKLSIFQNESTLVAGEAGINNLVKNIAVMEVPDFRISGEDERVFLLTTLYVYKDEPEKLYPTLLRLFQSNNVAGIAVKLDRFVHQLPESVLELANRCAIPLFVLAKTVTFRRAIIEITDKLIDDRSEMLTSINDLSESLLKIVLNNRGVYGIVNTLSQRISSDCACLSLNEKRIIEVFSSKAQLGLGNPEQLIDRLESESVKLPKDATYFSMDEWLVFPCRVRNQTAGYLLICQQGQLSEQLLMMVKQAVSFLSICFLEERARLEAEQRVIAPIANKILFSTYADQTELENDLKTLGLTPLEYFVVIAVELSPDRIGGGYTRVRNLQRKLKAVFDSVVAVPDGENCAIIASVRGEVLSGRDNTLQNTLRMLVDEAEKEYAGYSISVTDPRKIPECYKQAKKAIQYGKAAVTGQNVFSYMDYLTLGMVSQSLGTMDAEVMYDTMVHPLVEHDKNYDTCLWRTLEVALTEESLNQSAKELYIHISTLRYRLEKIRQITGSDFFTAAGRFKLYLAYMLYLARGGSAVSGKDI